MSIQTPNYRNSSTEKDETQGEKLTMSRYQSYKSNIENNINSSTNNEKSSLNQGKVYTYPILIQKERDPLEDFKLRIIQAKNQGSDNFYKNYLKFNFSKNDAGIYDNNRAFHNQIYNSNKKSQISLLENSKNSLFITENQNQDIKLDNPKLKRNLENSLFRQFKSISVLTNKPEMKKSRSDILNPYSKEALSQYRTIYLHEMEKRGNMYNKIKIAQLQRIALHNFSYMSLNGNHYINGSIPSGKADESYILETKKRKRLPGIKEYICSRLKSMKSEEVNTPEYYRERSKKYEKNKLPELINIKNSGRFQFHVFHDQYGYKKELDKKINPELKMTKEKVRDLKIMAKINKINDPELIDRYRKVVYNS